MQALTDEQFNAVLAGLRLLQRSQASEGVEALDPDIYSVATNSGQSEVLPSEAIDELCDALNMSAEVMLQYGQTPVQDRYAALLFPEGDAIPRRDHP